MNDIEKKLIDDIAAGKSEQFEVLIKPYQQKTFNIVMRYLGDHESALDVTQDTFIKVYRNLGKFKGDSELGTWIYRIAINSCKDHLIKKKELYPMDDEMVMQIPDSRDGPLEKAMKRETVELVHLALGKLDIESREIIILRDIEGFVYEEICRLLDIPVGTVKSRISRARRKLREEILNLDSNILGHVR